MLRHDAGDETRAPRRIDDYAQPAPLHYYVTPPSRPRIVLYGPVSIGEAQEWARANSRYRGEPMEVRQTSSEMVLFSYGPDGCPVEGRF